MSGMLEKIKIDLGTNYHEANDNVLKNLINYYMQIASNTSNRNIYDEKLEPYVYTAVKEAYIRRGDEGSFSSNEGGLSATYVDIEEKLRKDREKIEKRRERHGKSESWDKETSKTEVKKKKKWNNKFN